MAGSGSVGVFLQILAPMLLILAHFGVPQQAEGCLNCGAEFKNLRARYVRLCAQFQKQYPRANCTKYPWGWKAVQGFALDEASLDMLLEKAHRVFRVIEINQSLIDFPKFWNWLHEIKLPEKSREALCPPTCQASTSIFNCSTCRRAEIPCWDSKTCYPQRKGLIRVVMIVGSISGSFFILGLVSCAVE
ncbi:sperm-egg fusion protein TMEM95 [Anolis sagrei]|uniref:sperm-egg fusion protein TMEM95 n=1 Tax=Anolis sagrei TaxID=38937 RepID=UPI003521422E